MTALTLGLSLSNSFTKVGAIAAFVALVGIAILSLLVFSQAREIKRLREWAGRAPERAAEMEQRVSADAAARMLADRRSQGPSVGGSAPSMPQGRVVPRTTPLVSAPVATAVGASAAAVTPAASASPAATPASGSPGVPAASASSPGAEADQPSATASAGSPTEQPSPAQAAAVASAGGVVAAESEQDKPVATPAPVTAAGQGATRTAPRAPLPPSPAAPKPASPRSSSIPAAQASSSRVVSSRPRAAAVATGSAASAGAGAAAGGGRKDFRQERSPTRAIVLGAGVLIVVVLVLIFAVSALKGGGSSTPTTAQSSIGAQTASSTSQSTTAHKTGRSAVAANPAETAVVVLNGTATTGLAHHLASDLQQSGYTQALASAAVPPGTHQSTVVEYSSGHRADARGVARTLNVTQLQPMESTIAGLASSATVVVLAGADQAAQLGGGGAHSQGEPAAGQ